MTPNAKITSDLLFDRRMVFIFQRPRREGTEWIRSRRFSVHTEVALSCILLVHLADLELLVQKMSKAVRGGGRRYIYVKEVTCS